LIRVGHRRGLRCVGCAVFDTAGGEICSERWLGGSLDRGRDLVRVRNPLLATFRGGNLWTHSRFVFLEAFIWEISATATGS